MSKKTSSLKVAESEDFDAGHQPVETPANTSEAAGAGDEDEDFAPPPGYEEQTTEVVGFYVPTRAIHFVPETVILADNKTLGTRRQPKVSIMVIGTLVEPANLSTRAEDETGKKTTEVLTVKGLQGDKVGIWYKPGMAAIRDLCGVPVYMFPNGTKDTGMPKPMAVFKVLSKHKGSELKVSIDRRQDSASIKVPFALPAGTLAAGDDNLPF